jgi:DEAD/DEAH box helicase domain-containing protein
VLVANSTPLNQFIARHPDYFFDAPVERGRINPDNLQILVNHIKCAAFELPFADDESFGGEDLREILTFLEDEKLLHRSGGRWHWTSESYPADAVSLRSVSSDNFVVQDVTRDPRIIAEVDYDSAPSMVHEKAIYILEGRTYFVEKYDHEERRVQVREADVDYYTDAITYTRVKILDRFEEEAVAGARRNRGEVHVTSQVVGFKKIKFYTNENVGAGDLRMPENEMHTTAYWLTVPREIMAALPYTGEERRDGVVALSYTLGQMAALFLMCDRHDLGVALGDNGQGEARVERGLTRLGFASRQDAPPGQDYEPNVFIYDNYPGGIGLSEPLYRLHGRLLGQSLSLISACPCHDGCPSCVGPAGEAGSRGKEVALALLRAILG